jgi:type VII secretion integral membrane protein EccD
MTAATAPSPTGRLSRVTLVGPRRRVDLVLPADEPVGVLLPDIVTMLGPGSRSPDPGAHQLTMVDGTVLGPAATLRGAGVPDGALIHLDRLTEAPPAPTVLDVTDEVADDLHRRRGRWGPAARTTTATAVVVLAVLAAAQLAVPWVGVAALAIAGSAVLLAGTAFAAAGWRDPGVALLLGGAAVVIIHVPAIGATLPKQAALVAVAIAVTVQAVAVATDHARAGTLGAGTVLLLTAGWTVLLRLGVPAERAAAVMAVIAVAALGLLPRWTMIVSGLTRLDDRAAGQEPVPREAALAAVDDAHRGLAVACVAVAASGALSGWLLAQAASGWATALAVLLGLALLLRLRAFPLAVEVTALVAAALCVVAGLVHRWLRAVPEDWWAGGLVVLAVAALALLVLSGDAAPHVRARARQVADRVEAIAVIALVPVVVGLFGVYARLLETF